MITGNEPINPTVWDERHRPEIIRDNDGLTIRQHFAAMAMQGYMANQYTPHQDTLYIAEYAVKCADALINELNKKP